MRIRWYGRSAFLLDGERRAGGGPTIGGERAAAAARALRPRLVVPLHYRTAAVDFPDPPDALLAALAPPVVELNASEVETDELPDGPRSSCSRRRSHAELPRRARAAPAVSSGRGGR